MIGKVLAGREYSDFPPIEIKAGGPNNPNLHPPTKNDPKKKTKNETSKDARRPR